MTHVPVELIPHDGGELEVRLRLNLEAEPLARRRHDNASRQQEVTVLRARESQLNAALDDLSQRLGRAQADLNDRGEAHARLETAYRQRELELEDRCCLLLEQQRELLDSLEQAEAEIRGAAAPPVARVSPPAFSAVRTEITPPPPAPVPTTQTFAGPPELAPMPHVDEAPVLLPQPIQLLDRPAVEMASPRSTWTRHPTIDPYDHSVELGGGVARLFHRLQIMVGMTPNFARVDMGGVSDWDDLPDDWDAEAIGLGEPWYRKPLAWVAIAALIAGIGLALTSKNVGPSLDQVFERNQALPSYLE